MKTINFSVEGSFDKILDRTKILTIRGLYVPDYVEEDIVILREIIRDSHGNRQPARSTEARITCVEPILLCDITDKIAREEGFNNAKESVAWLRKTYRLKDEKRAEARWFFLISWRRVNGVQETLKQYTGEKNE